MRISRKHFLAHYYGLEGNKLSARMRFDSNAASFIVFIIQFPQILNRLKTEKPSTKLIAEGLNFN